LRGCVVPADIFFFSGISAAGAGEIDGGSGGLGDDVLWA
jgi:hypothetical protein